MNWQKSSEQPRSQPPSGVGSTGDGSKDGLRDRVRRYEVKLILEALEATGGNQTKAAHLLKLPLRTLAHKLKMLGIRRPGYKID